MNETVRDSLVQVANNTGPPILNVDPDNVPYYVFGFLCFLAIALFLYFIDIKRAPEDKKPGQYLKGLLILGLSGWLGVSAFSSMLDWEYRLGIQYIGPFLGTGWMLGLIASAKALGISFRMATAERQYVPRKFGYWLIVLAFASTLVFGALIPYVDVTMTIRDYGRAITKSIMQKDRDYLQNFFAVNKIMEDQTAVLMQSGKASGDNLILSSERERIKDMADIKNEYIGSVTKQIQEKYESGLFVYGEKVADYIAVQMMENGNTTLSPTSQEIAAGYDSWKFDTYLIAFGISIGSIFGIAFVTFVFPSPEIRRIVMNLLQDMTRGNEEYAKLVEKQALASIAMEKSMYITDHAHEVGQRLGRAALEKFKRTGNLDEPEEKASPIPTSYIPTNGHTKTDDLPEQLQPEKVRRKKKGKLIRPKKG
ncbi:MAG: hypothetical protein ACPGO5_04230 [Patescibacteria group bacterium]